jgi:hypothetical protein
MEVPIMARMHKSREEAPFFSVPQARWVIGVLSMLIAVVGKDSLLGLILRQARFEINSIVEDEAPPAVRAARSCYENN